MTDSERIRLAERLLALERALRDALAAVDGMRRVLAHPGVLCDRRDCRS